MLVTSGRGMQSLSGRYHSCTRPRHMHREPLLIGCAKFATAAHLQAGHSSAPADFVLG